MCETVWFDAPLWGGIVSDDFRKVELLLKSHRVVDSLSVGLVLNNNGNSRKWYAVDAGLVPPGSIELYRDTLVQERDMDDVEYVICTPLGKGVGLA